MKMGLYNHVNLCHVAVRSGCSTVAKVTDVRFNAGDNVLCETKFIGDET